jgi:hypothetical protein
LTERGVSDWGTPRRATGATKTAKPFSASGLTEEAAWRDERVGKERADGSIADSGKFRYLRATLYSGCAIAMCRNRTRDFKIVTVTPSVARPF